ncbi:hypothetical protein [Helicobacter marmotae]|uniref:hypothetical protein n=1 Tax=Helicobacter marmotae TaxID=152490 RepID=UPI0011C01BA0|nr:hypothetical protein [Helicobacter marmotae]
MDKASEKSPSQTPSGSKVCHSEHCEEIQPELPANPLVCHSEGGRSPTEESLFDSPEILQVCHSERSEESLRESLVAKRDSSLDSQALDMTISPKRLSAVRHALITG